MLPARLERLPPETRELLPLPTLLERLALLLPRLLPEERLTLLPPRLPELERLALLPRLLELPR